MTALTPPAVAFVFQSRERVSFIWKYSTCLMQLAVRIVSIPRTGFIYLKVECMCYNSIHRGSFNPANGFHLFESFGYLLKWYIIKMFQSRERVSFIWKFPWFNIQTIFLLLVSIPRTGFIYLKEYRYRSRWFNQKHVSIPRTGFIYLKDRACQLKS